jgi:hypothetical protein
VGLAKAALSVFYKAHLSRNVSTDRAYNVIRPQTRAALTQMPQFAEITPFAVAAKSESALAKMPYALTDNAWAAIRATPTHVLMVNLSVIMRAGSAVRVSTPTSAQASV